MARIAVYKTRGYCFTLNNPTAEEEKDINDLNYRYLTYGREIGENGTPHLQGYVHFATQRPFNTVKGLIPRWHVEQRKGTIEQAITYCHKDGDYVEHGDIPTDNKSHATKGGQANKQRWKEILQRAQQGDTQWVMEKEPKFFIQYGARLESLRAVRPANLDGPLRNEWWVGPTGTGKSKLLWELYPNHYAKRLNKWWDGYARQNVVAIEEWSPKNDVTGSALKIWADRYVFDGEVKGGTLMGLRPTKIIVLSNYTIDQCFTAQEDREPLKRRFKQLTFPQDKPWARTTATDIQAQDTQTQQQTDTTTIDNLLADEHLSDIDLFETSEDLLKLFD